LAVFSLETTSDVCDLLIFFTLLKGFDFVTFSSWSSLDESVSVKDFSSSNFRLYFDPDSATFLEEDVLSSLPRSVGIFFVEVLSSPFVDFSTFFFVDFDGSDSLLSVGDFSSSFSSLDFSDLEEVVDVSSSLQDFSICLLSTDFSDSFLDEGFVLSSSSTLVFDSVCS